MAKSVNLSEKRVENRMEKKPIIEGVLRKSAVVGAIAVSMLSVSPAKAQQTTNIDLGTTHISMDWEPGRSQTYINQNGSLNYAGFDSSLGTLDSVTLSLSLSYDNNLHVATAGPNNGQVTTSLSPFLQMPGGLTTIPLGSMTLAYNITGAAGPLPGNIFDQSGTLTYDLTFTSPSDLNQFLNSGTLDFSLPNSDSSPYAPVWQNSPNFDPSSIVIENNMNQTIDPTLSFTFTPEATPEPSTIALTGLGAAALVLLRRKRN